MKTLNLKIATVFLVLGLLALSTAYSTEVRAQASGVDQAAVQTLKRMTDYLGSLHQFSVHTQNTLEDVLDSGHRIDMDVSASVIISRPNKLRAERKGALIDQVFYYNGKTLTLYNPYDNVYATESAPETVDELLDYARESLGLTIPAADLIYRNAFPLLMKDVTLAMVLDRTAINGIECDHVLFSRPGVDFQVWVADGEQPLPMKYVVTDTSQPGNVSITTVMSDWNVAPAVADARFTFVQPKGVKQISFMPLEKSSGSSR